MISLIILIAAFIVFVFKRNLTYLHIFQQHEYNNTRFLQWILCNFAIDKRLSIILCFFLGYATNLINKNLSSVINIIAISILVCAYVENNPIRHAKKKLTMTSRAKRIFYLALFINAIFHLTLLNYLNLSDLNFNNSTTTTNHSTLNNYFLYLILNIHFIPIWLVLTNLMLKPIEKQIQQKFWQEAKQKIATHNPFIIAITGSFGKTSVKHFLGHILQQVDHTLITSGSINTSMGISRSIREELNTAHKYFIIEMGAYGIGSIKELCALTPPNFGIITAIGLSHYERFKTLENVANAKFELADAVINNAQNNPDNKNKVIISEKVLNTDYANEYLKNHKDFLSVLQENQISNVCQTKNGISLDLKLDLETYHIETPIFGIHNAINIAISFLAAYTLGTPPAIILAAVKNMPQIKHRLEVSNKDDCIIIDDSYNSNPDGFKSALELLSFLKQPTGRRILVTPGLVELGKKHETEHFLLGQYAANHVDLALIINPERIASFIVGFNSKKQTNPDSVLIMKHSFKEAKKWLDLNCHAKDTILLANDLPDLYETRLKI
jgi:UDP-N-acetylmuramoyl-tripeptide--D-alanyl-D-alanine ligase